MNHLQDNIFEFFLIKHNRLLYFEKTDFVHNI